MSLQTRAIAALAKGISLFFMGLWVFGSTAYPVLVLGVPSAEIMGVVGFLALAANVASFCCWYFTRMATLMSAPFGYAPEMTPSATWR